ncbi:MAG: ABC transporter-like protein [Rhodospirillaceae bacterium]|nr:MAG: ABC transporter-like protein [Rhodospirillaceae bacterium]
MPESGLDLTVHQQAPIPLVARCLCAPGEVLALVGPSGSGKSTLLRCIAGLVSPRAGRIVVGRETWFDTDAHVNLAPRHRRVGFLFQNYGLFPNLSALDNVREGVSRLRLPVAEQKKRARALLALVHLTGLEDRHPRELSGGQQQRVAVARALAGEPDVLLLDEPSSAVDRVTREKLQNELSDLRRHLAMPVILVTHDLEEAMLLADRLCVLSRGRTLQTGAPLEVLERPATAEVVRLLGLHNVFPGRVMAHRQGALVLDWNGQPLTVAPHPQYPPG